MSDQEKKPLKDEDLAKVSGGADQNGRKFVCPTCKKEFSNGAKLVAHMNKEKHL